MDALLSPVSSIRHTSAAAGRPLVQEPSATRQPFTASSADEALEVLRNEPNYETLVAVLRFLLAGTAVGADILQPTPLAAQLVQVLVTAIVPNYWPLLRDEHQRTTKTGGRQSDLELLLACLRSVTGLSALITRLRALLAEAKAAPARSKRESDADDSIRKKPPAESGPAWQLRILLEVLADLLAGDNTPCQVWAASTSGTAANDDAKRRPLTQEFLNLVGGGRVVSLAAEAEAVTKAALPAVKLVPAWLASGKDYSAWLTRGVIHWTRQGSEDDKMCGALLGKALQIGYPGAVVATLVSDLALSDEGADSAVLARLLSQLPAHEQKKILSGVLAFSAKTYFGSFFSAGPTAVDAGIVSAVAGLIKRFVDNSTLMHEQLVAWLLAAAADGLSGGIGVRRAAVGVLAENNASLATLFEKSMAEFGDQLYTKHAPILQQESKAQVLLLAAGYISRNAPRSLASVLPSRTFLDMVSNRLAASNQRVKYLGMVVGEALSGLVDDDKKRLDFHMDDTKSDEAVWLKGLVQVSDTVGSPGALRKATPTQDTLRPSRPQAGHTKQATVKPVRRQPVLPRKAGFVIEELDDDDDSRIQSSNDDGLAVYAKPDSDAEDSDDDPTLVRRDKPKAPVYIRDLIAYFRDTENYDRQKLALTTVPLLIRRKAGFGTEVQQHAQELASILVGLHDSFDMDDFADLRLQGMVALVVAQPRTVAPWFSLTFFEGDYSLAQRASLLTALGLAAREIAGFDVFEQAAAAAFPSKQLPERVEQLYITPSHQPSAHPSSQLKALAPGALDSIADAMTASFLGPVAARAADDATGPDVLKLASFKSRVASQTKAKTKITKPKRQTASTGTANTAGQLLASAFFFPLIARFQLALQATSSSSSSSRRTRSFLFEPALLALYLKTLAVVLHAAGPGALALPDMTAEMWSLLLGSSVQAHCAGDAAVTHAVLFALLALLDVNEHRVRELCRDLPGLVVQTRDWALQVLEGAQAGGGSSSSGQESEIQMLAAGTYIRLTEGMESYRNLLLGEMIG